MKHNPGRTGIAEHKPELEERKVQFAALNDFISRRNGWLTSVPGDPLMRFEVIPGSPLPDELRKAGYIVTEIGQSQRIIPHAITERVVANADGGFAPATAGSTRPIVRTVSHAGIVAVYQYSLRRPSAPPEEGMRIRSS